jgi:uncharacterized membrane protein
MTSVRISDRRVATLAALGLASVLCLGLLAARELNGYSADYRFLGWNLFLAWIPLALALTLYDSDRRGRRLTVLVPVAAAWLLFLPNAPYLVTDFVHVGSDDAAPTWFDAGMVASFAVTGLVLGLVSVLLVQGVLARRYGSAVGWLTLPPIFLLCSAGIYLGRVHRFNSWDALTRPGALLDTFAARLAGPLPRPETIVALVGLMGMLAVAYLVVYTISDLRLDEPRRRERD